jgi:hypothetical protein
LDLKAPVSREPGGVIFRHMVKTLKELPARCAEVKGSEEDVYPQLYDLDLVGNSRGLTLSELFLHSPTSRLLGPSGIVSSALERNKWLFLPRGPRNIAAPSDPFKRMMAVHIRRGDYEGHCRSLARCETTYFNWNLWPTLPDPLVLPANCGKGLKEQELVEIIRKHCFPTPKETAATIRHARDEYLEKHGSSNSTVGTGVLDVLYVMTNADSTWVKELAGFMNDETNGGGGGWSTVVGSPDMVFDNEQKEMGMAVDVLIGRKAEVFIGNGWSSFTSNVVHGRLVDERPPLSIRFW